MAMDLPAHAQERLKGLRTNAHSSGVFTSDFSVNEFLLVRKAGFEPIGLCVGTCVYHVGVQYGSWSKQPGAGCVVPRHVPRPRTGHGADAGGGLGDGGGRDRRREADHQAAGMG